MRSSKFFDPDAPRNSAQAAHSQSRDITSQRQELARLIGRLLAKHWLQQQRDKNQGPTSHEAASREAVDSD
jgi:hypothetical protein